MTRENRILSTFVLLGLLTLSLSDAARSQSTPPKTVTISGYTGVVGVTLRGFPGTPVTTDENGFYSAEVPQGWAGTVTPVKLGYAFVPPSRTFTDVAESLENQDYVATLLTFTISGNVGLPGVVLQGFPQEVVSDPQGKYQAQVDYGWSGTVTPMKEGYQFEPHSRQYTKVVRNSVKENYTAKITEFTISGNAGVPGALILGLPGEVVTDTHGEYAATVPLGWSGELTPKKEGYTFEPSRRSYRSVTKDLIGQDYTARVRMVAISNVVMVDREPLEGVRIVAEPGGYSARTDAQGRYRIEVPYGWSGELVFAELDDPEARLPYTNVTSDLIEGPPVRGRSVTISNVVQAGSEPIQGVKVTAKPGEYATLTDSQGRYRIQVPYGWSGRLVLSKEGWDIGSETEYSSVTRDIIDGKSVPAGREWPPYEPRTSRGGVSVPAGNVLVIPTADAAPERIAETTEDLRVMLQILREKLSEPRMIRGVLRDYGSLLGEDRRAEAIYLEGSAALFVIGADFPPSSPAQQPGEGEPPSRPQGEAADPVWQRARQKLYSPGAGTPSPSGQMQTMTFEQFQEELLRSLKHAANIRHIDPNELVVLTLVAQNGDADRAGEAEIMEQYKRIYGADSVDSMLGIGRSARSAAVLTMQAKKADIDAFAQGTLDFDQFRQKVRSFTY